MSPMRAVLLALGLASIVGAAFVVFVRYQLAHVKMTEAARVSVSAPGLSATQVESQVTEPLEQALSSIAGLDSLRSTSSAGLSVIELRVTTEGVEATPAMTLLREALGAVQRQLPQDVDPPILQRVELDRVEQRFLLTSDTMSRVELSQWIDEELRRKVEVQVGVREVQTCGALESELRIELDPQRLRAMGLTPGEVQRAIESSALDVPGGRIGDFRLRTSHRNLEALENVSLGKNELRLRDVATFERTGRPGRCRTDDGVLVTLDLFPSSKPNVPTHPAVKLSSLVPARMVTYESSGEPPPRIPGAVVTLEGNEVRAFFAEAPTTPPLVPGLQLRSVDEPHTLLRVSGPDFEELTRLATKLRDELAKEPGARWVGNPWPTVAPEKVITPSRDARDVASTLELVLAGKDVGELEDRTRIRLHVASSLEDAVLEDGRRLTDAVRIEETLAPRALLRVNRQRTVELETSLEASTAKRIVERIELPAGSLVSVH
jgi:multidrug efflux pump subunit AcrB